MSISTGQDRDPRVQAARDALGTALRVPSPATADLAIALEGLLDFVDGVPVFEPGEPGMAQPGGGWTSGPCNPG